MIIVIILWSISNVIDLWVVQSLLVLIGKKQKDKQKQNQNMKQGKGEEGRGGEGMFPVKEWWENHFYPA